MHTPTALAYDDSTGDKHSTCAECGQAIKKTWYPHETGERNAGYGNWKTDNQETNCKGKQNG